MRAYVILNLVALVFIVIRGLSFPDPNGGATPWYTQPGFIAGIPAVPWVMPGSRAWSALEAVTTW